LSLSVGVGLGVLTELLEEEVDDVVGPKGKHDPGRAAVVAEVHRRARHVDLRRHRHRLAVVERLELG